MTNNTDAATLLALAGPTREQALLLQTIGQVLDKQAGDGLGTTLDDGSTVWMDDLVGRIAETFGLNPDVPLDLAIRQALEAARAQVLS